MFVYFIQQWVRFSISKRSPLICMFMIRTRPMTGVEREEKEQKIFNLLLYNLFIIIIKKMLILATLFGRLMLWGVFVLTCWERSRGFSYRGAMIDRSRTWHCYLKRFIGQVTFRRLHCNENSGVITALLPTSLLYTLKNR